MDEDYEEDRYSLTVKVTAPDAPEVAITLAWAEEQDSGAIADAAHDLARQAVQISLNMLKVSKEPT